MSSNTNNAVSTSQNQQQGNTATKHAKTLKLYLAILALYLASFIPMTLILVFNARIFAYGPSLNHVGNVLIYYLMIKTFRKQSNAIMCKTLSKCFARNASEN